MENKTGILRTYKFGYEKNNPSYDYFKYKILEDNSTKKLEKSYYTANLNNAKQYFDKQLEEFIQDDPKKIDQILNKVTNFLQFNVYEIEEGFDVNVAFETMNNRGKKLSNLEILKNRLIYLLTMYDGQVLSMPEKDSIRNKINEAWKEIYRQLGRDESNKLEDDEFLKNHWIMYFKYSRQRGDDYIKYLLQDFFTVRAIHGKTRHIEIHESNLDDEMESYDIFEDDNVLHYDEIIHYVDSLSKLSRYWLLSKKPELALEEGYTDQEG